MSDEPKPASPEPGEADAGRPRSKAKPAANKAPAKGRQADPRLIGLGVAAFAGLVIGLLLGALLLGGDDDEGDVVAASAGGSEIVSPADLTAEAQSLGRPVYWAGPQDGSEIEFERTKEGNTSVRYIPEGEDAGGAAADYLTIVTYPYPKAYEALQEQAASGDVISRDLPDGGFMISQPDQPTNAYLAYKDEDYQVEVYDPRPGQALKLVTDGSVVKAE